MQADLALGLTAGDPGPHALTRDPHRRSDMGLRPPFAEPLDDQHSAMESGAGITVGHENLRSGMGLRQATPHPGVLLVSSQRARYQRLGQVHLGGDDHT